MNAIADKFPSRRIPDPEEFIEIFYMNKSRTNIYTAFENLDFHWSLDEVRKVEDAYEQDLPVDLIADAIGRHADEVGMLIMSRVNEGRLKPRATGAYGWSLPFDPAKNDWLTEGQKNAIVRILKSGASRADIAQAVGIPTRLVDYLWRKRKGTDA
ncbi:hypothetical protein ACOALA_03985 [Alicyclobacillus acidoterrestris]|uniref:hypothetical protein n=1 Tax=Alicyclobacillus acidoterrestris TaxID=1450 RepID=UPI003F52BDE4